MTKKDEQTLLQQVNEIYKTTVLGQLPEGQTDGIPSPHGSGGGTAIFEDEKSSIALAKWEKLRNDNAPQDQVDAAELEYHRAHKLAVANQNK